MMKLEVGLTLIQDVTAQRLSGVVQTQQIQTNSDQLSERGYPNPGFAEMPNQ